MNIVEHLNSILGSWQGSNAFRLMPTDEYQVSAATVDVEVLAGAFVAIKYTWSTDDKPQNGMLLLSSPSDSDEITTVWLDSFHSSPAWMDFTGPVNAEGTILLAGSYPAPSGPDWGWEIHVERTQITMHNLVPGHPAYQVVALEFHS